MLAPSVLQPRKSEVKHGIRQREQEARRQRANRSTAPSTSATASIARESRTPTRTKAPSMRQSPQRAPGRKPDSGALAWPSIGLRGAHRAEQRVPRALAGPSSKFPRRKIVCFVQPWSKSTILRSLKAKTLDYLRYRKAHTRTTGKKVRFSLPKP